MGVRSIVSHSKLLSTAALGSSSSVYLGTARSPVSLIHHANARTSWPSNVRSEPRFLSLFSDVAHTDLNESVTLVTVPMETLALSSLSVAEASAPKMNSLSMSLGGYDAFYDTILGTVFDGYSGYKWRHNKPHSPGMIFSFPASIKQT